MELLDHVQRTHLPEVRKDGAENLARESANLSKAGVRHVAQSRLDQLTDVALPDLMEAVRWYTEPSESDSDGGDQQEDDAIRLEELKTKLKTVLIWYGEAVLATGGALPGNERAKPSDSASIKLRQVLTDLS